MFRQGTIVTLVNGKEYFDGIDNVTLGQGVAGMVMQARLMSHGREQEYVVEFGAYGQTNCLHSELSGQDTLGLTLDNDGNERLAPAPSVADSFLEGIGHDIEDDEDKESLGVIDFEADHAAMVARLEKEIY